MTWRYRNRSGLYAVVSLVAMGIVTSIGLAAVTTASRARRQTRTMLHLRQTELLLEAGIARAVRSPSDADWNASDALPFAAEADVQIRVRADRVRVVATVRPPGSPTITRSEEFQRDAA